MGGLHGSSPRTFPTPISPISSSSLVEALLCSEGRQGLTKENETLDGLDPSPSPRQDPPPKATPDNPHPRPGAGAGFSGGGSSSSSSGLTHSQGEASWGGQRSSWGGKSVGVLLAGMEELGKGELLFCSIGEPLMELLVTWRNSLWVPPPEMTLPSSLG